MDDSGTSGKRGSLADWQKRHDARHIAKEKLKQARARFDEAQIQLAKVQAEKKSADDLAVVDVYHEWGEAAEDYSQALVEYGNLL
jgi:hypothetical protein